MNAPRTAFLSSCALFAGAAVVAVLAARSIPGANAGLVAAARERALLEASIGRAELRTADSRREASRLNGLLDGVRSRLGGPVPRVVPADAAAIDLSVHAIPRRVWEQRALARDPRLQALCLAAERAGLPQKYGPLWSSLGLSADQIARFSEIAMEGAERMLDVASSAQAQGLDPSDPAVAGLRRQAEDQQAAAQIDLLGEPGYQQLKEFERQAPMRSFVDALAGSLAVTGDPLSGPQASQLAQIMAGTNPSYAAGGTADDPIVHSFDEPLMAHVPAAEAVDPAAVLAQARGVLSDAQLGALQAQLERNHEVIQLFNELQQMPGNPMMGFAMWRM
jgi:hypothetical protein